MTLNAMDRPVKDRYGAEVDNVTVKDLVSAAATAGEAAVALKLPTPIVQHIEAEAILSTMNGPKASRY